MTYLSTESPSAGKDTAGPLYVLQLVSKLVGALSPVNHKGLFEG